MITEHLKGTGMQTVLNCPLGFQKGRRPWPRRQCARVVGTRVTLNWLVEEGEDQADLALVSTLGVCVQLQLRPLE